MASPLLQSHASAILPSGRSETILCEAEESPWESCSLVQLSGRGVSQVEPGVTLMSEQDGVACFPASTVTDILSPNEEMKPSPWCVGKALECKGWRGRFFSDPLCGYEISPGHRSTPP